MVSRRQFAVLFMAVCLLAEISRIRGEVFTAIVEMEKLLKAEYAVAQDLKQYILKEEARLAKLKSIADDYEQHSATALRDVENYLGNPVNAFLLVKRFTTDWEDIVSTYIRTNNTDDVLAAIAGKTALFPEQTDLEGAVAALLRLQDTYALPTSKIANGELAPDVVSPVMSSVDCFEIGRLAYLSKDYYHTILWMEQSMHALQREHSTSHAPTARPTEILDYLAYAVYMQGNIQHALNLTIEWLKYEPDHERAQRNKVYYEQMVRDEEAAMGRGARQDEAPAPLKNERPRDAYRSSREFHDYERLCRGEDIRPNPHARKLTCRYVRHHPIFYLSPAKEETMYLEPWIVVYRDVLTEREMAKIKELAIPRLNRATVSNPKTGNLEFANYRVSKSAWLKDEEDMLINRVTLKTVAMTNLTTATVEELQVVNYGIGGHYEPHYDFARSHERNAFDEWRGNRIATVIFYMSDVAAGGATVFPDLGVKLWPEKGACAMWFNLLKNGEGDLRTRHAACPVLTGSKWVCNKWYHERGQEFARPCSTDPKE